MVSKVISVSEKLSEYRVAGFFKQGVIGYRIDMGLGVIGIVSIWVGQLSERCRFPKNKSIPCLENKQNLSFLDRIIFQLGK